MNQMSRVAKLSIISFLAITVCRAKADTISINTFDLGWYKSGGAHTSGNVNTYTGSYYNNQEYRSFYLWNLPNFEGKVVSATLMINLVYPLGTVGLKTQSGEMFDVSDSNLAYIRKTNGDGHGVDIWNDLGSGLSYGQFVITSQDSGWVSYDLNAAAISEINTSKGEVFAMGIDNTSVNGYGSGYFLFSSGSVRGKQYLVLETIDNNSPIADAGNDFTAPAGQNCLATTTLDGTGSWDPDMDPLIYYWEWAAGSATGATPRVELPLGTNSITLYVSDGIDISSDTVRVIVMDVTPPTLCISATPSTLWPPTHRMERVAMDIFVADNCDTSPDVQLVSITSNEGNQTDFGIMDIYDVMLRSERNGNDQTRIYTLHYKATDFSGNSTTLDIDIEVPHDQRTKNK